MRLGVVMVNIPAQLRPHQGVMNQYEPYFRKVLASLAEQEARKPIARHRRPCG